MLFKQPDKIIQIAYAAEIGDLLQRERRGIQQINSVFHSYTGDMGSQRAAGFLSEKRGQIAFIHRQNRGDLL